MCVHARAHTCAHACAHTHTHTHTPDGTMPWLQEQKEEFPERCNLDQSLKHQQQHWPKVQDLKEVIELNESVFGYRPEGELYGERKMQCNDFIK